MKDGTKSFMGELSIQNAWETNGFNVIEYKKSIDKIPDSTLQLTFKELPLVNFWFIIQEKSPQLSQRLLETFLPFSTMCLYKAAFFIYINQIISQQFMCRSRYQNPLLSSIKPKNVRTASIEGEETLGFKEWNNRLWNYKIRITGGGWTPQVF